MGKINNFYDPGRVSKYYETVGGDIENKETAEYDKLINELIPDSLEEKVVLDLGCGNGLYSEQFCKKDARRVIAMDLSESMLVEVKKRKEEKKLDNLEIVQGDMDNLAIGKEKIDYIFSRFSLVHSGKMEQVVASLSDSLTENGEMLVSVNYVSRGDQDDLDKIKNNPVSLVISIGDKKVEVMDYIYSLNDYIKAFENAGLQVLVSEQFVADNLGIKDKHKYSGEICFGYSVFQLKKRA